MRSIELFAGAGGLALGLARSGFHHEMVIERHRDAAETLRSNHRFLNLAYKTQIWELDTRVIDFRRFEGQIDLLSGGPPCQPFSIGGKYSGELDHRDMFPEVFRAMHEMRPKAVIVENVKGLALPRFSEYFEYIKLRLSLPSSVVRTRETWVEHRKRLIDELKSSRSALKYTVQFHRWNAANFGVPQKRDRVFFIAIQEDLGIQWVPPTETHGVDRLIWDKWVTGEYWDRHAVTAKEQSDPDPRLRSRLNALMWNEDPPKVQPWRTVRDAISGLTYLEEGETDPNDPSHFLNPGARSYPGHTGSPLDEPAKTLKAGDHGVPGGENILRRLDGSVRYFSVRECACLQSFPDEYEFRGAWCEQMRQVGNAVPVILAETVGCSLAAALTIN